MVHVEFGVLSRLPSNSEWTWMWVRAIGLSETARFWPPDPQFWGEPGRGPDRDTGVALAAEFRLSGQEPWVR
jgi:hypothetical protein